MQEEQEPTSYLRRGIPSVQDTDILNTTQGSSIIPSESRRYHKRLPSAHTALSSSTNDRDYSHINNLPDEIICLIFEELSDLRDSRDDSKRQIYTVAWVCKRWSAIALPLLWREIYLSNHTVFSPYYCDPLATTLALHPSAWMNLKFTRRLRLRFNSNYCQLISSQRECEEIISNMSQLRQILISTTSAKSLWIRFDPFVPSDCEYFDLWSDLHQANDIMAETALSIRERGGEMDKLEISLGREDYRYDELSRVEIDRILRALSGVPVTALTLYESSLVHVNGWLKEITNLQQLRLSLHTNDFEDRDIVGPEFWEQVNKMGIETLDLRAGVPSFGRNFQWPSLRKVLLGRVESSLNVAQVIFANVPQLQVCAINRSLDRNIESDLIEPFRGSVLSTDLKSVTFKESVVPTGLLGKIAESSGSILEAFVFPRNTTDQDLQEVVSRSPCLRRANLGHAPAISDVGLSMMSSVTQLTTLKLHWLHLKFVRRELIEALVHSCPSLHSLRFLTFHTRASRARRLAIRQLDRKALRRWLSSFITVNINAGFVIIHLDWIRGFNEWRRRVTICEIGSDTEGSDTLPAEDVQG